MDIYYSVRCGEAKGKGSNYKGREMGQVICRVFTFDYYSCFINCDDQVDTLSNHAHL